MANKYEMKLLSHNEWAEAFLIEMKKDKTYKLNIEEFLKMIEVKSASYLLIQFYGFIYYSHDHEMYQPIIEKPNSYYFGKKATEEQLDALYAVMLMNRENAITCPIFEEEVTGYVASENRIETNSSAKLRR